MLPPSHIQPGVVLRVITSHGLGAPVGSLAKVKSIQTSLSGDWLCIVECHDTRQPKHGTWLYRSHLWASDLGRFEIVTEHPTRNHRQVRAHRPMTTKRLQLRLPFDEEEPR